MKFHLSAILLSLIALLGLSVGFEKEDHEIFRLRDEVIEAEGPEATFYTFLNVSQTANKDAIDKAYRTRSRRLHPDKAIRDETARRVARKKKTQANAYDSKKKPSVKVQKGLSQKERTQIAREANERYARLTTVANVLRGPLRDRYDHFLRNGFPIWKGTGYYYDRLRPGLGSVIIGLLIFFGGGAHYGAMYISWKRQREFVQRYITHARKMAWGNDTGVPGLPSLDNITNPEVPPQTGAEEEPGMALNRRQKRMQEKENRKKDGRGAAKGAKANGISRPVNAENLSSGPQGSRKKVVAENGKVLIVDSVGNVFLEDNTEEGEVHEFLLDPEEIPKPTIFQTALFRLPIFLYAKSVGRVVDKVRGVSDAEEETLLDEDGAELTMDMSNPEDKADAVFHSATSPNAHNEAKKRKSKGKA